MTELNIHIDQLIAEIEKAKCPDAEGFTTRDLVKIFNKRPRTVRDMVRELVDSGKVKFVGHRKVSRIDGVLTKVPVYQFVEE